MIALMRCIFLTLTLSAVIARAETPRQAVSLLGLNDLTAWVFVSASSGNLSAACKQNPDGSLAVLGKPVGYLATKIAYENYQLHAEWRWPVNAAKNSNSGVLLHLTGGPANGTAWPACLQMQLKPTRAGDLLPMHTAKFGEKLSTTPDAKTPQLDRRAADSEKPLGEWNSCDIVCRGTTIEITVNGVVQNRVTLCTPATGRIAFQLEGTPFELRNVRLAPLK
jgi:hypothetical protein